MSKSFISMIERASNQNESKVILALDLKGPNAIEKAERILEDISSYICGVKINKHLMLPFGLRRIESIVRKVHEFGLPVIADCKMCDIGSTNQMEASLYFDVGFDAITVMPLPGWVEGLESTFHLAEERDKGILAVVYMSHKGASEFFEATVYDEELRKFDKLYMVFLRKAIKWHADGFVIGATRPSIIRRVKEMVGDKPIFSPGVIVQGGSLVDALKAGASYVIIGRAICESPNPIDKAKELKNLTKLFS